jgi:hypothetical protein
MDLDKENQMSTYKPEDDEIDVEPFEGKPDYDRPQAGDAGKQDD